MSEATSVIRFAVVSDRRYSVGEEVRERQNPVSRTVSDELQVKKPGKYPRFSPASMNAIQKGLQAKDSASPMGLLKTVGPVLKIGFVR